MSRKALFRLCTLILVAVASSGFAAYKFYWRNVNEDPYSGTVGSALKIFVSEFGLPQAAMDSILTHGSEIGKLNKGRECIGMVSGNVDHPKIHANVVNDWIGYDELATDLYRYSDWELHRVHAYNNILLCRRREQAIDVTSAMPPPVTSPLPQPTPAAAAARTGTVSAPAPAATASQITTAVAPHYHLMRLRLWAKTAAVKLADSAGFSSQDLGEKIRAAAARGEVTPRQAPGECSGHFQVEFSKVDLAKLHGAIIINGEAVPISFAPPVPPTLTVKVPACGAEGDLEIPTPPPKSSWLKPETEVRIISPWGANPRRYPETGALRSCSTEEVKTNDLNCGKWARFGGGGFWGIVESERSRDRTSNWHFAR